MATSARDTQSKFEPWKNPDAKPFVRIDRVTGVSLMEFGTPEAMWHLEVRDFPAIVTMDADGNSLHKDVEEESGAVLETLRH